MQESQSFLSVRCRSKCRSRSHVSVLGAEVTVIPQYQVSAEQKSMARVSVKPGARPRAPAPAAKDGSRIRKKCPAKRRAKIFFAKNTQSEPLENQGENNKKDSFESLFCTFFFQKLFEWSRNGDFCALRARNSRHSP